MVDIEEWVTIDEAVSDERVPYTAYWLRTLCQQGRLKAVKKGKRTRGQWLIHFPSLLDYIQKMGALGAKKHSPH